MAYRYCAYLIVALLFPRLSLGEDRYHAAIGFTNSKGLFSMGYGGDKSFLALGLQQVHSVGGAYCFLPFAGFQRAFQAGHSPYLSLALNTLFSTRTEASFSIDGLEVNPGWNSGHVSGNLGYRLRFRRIDCESEVGVRTPLSSKFVKKWKYDFGAGVSLPFPFW